MARKIFVNYRRQDARADARNIRDRLARVFGPSNVFMDVDDLKVGQRFDHELKRALAQCDTFLTVIGPRWLDLLDERVRSSERDYVRDEVAGALARSDILIIPVVVDEAQLPRGEQLPEDIRSLVLHQKQELSHERYGRDMAEIITVIKGRRRRAAWRRWRVAVFIAVAAIAVGVVAGRQFGIPLSWPITVTNRSATGPFRPGQTFRDCQQCPEMVVLPAGEYMMGSPEGESGRSESEGPQHKVKIAKPFAVGKYEVTVKEYGLAVERQSLEQNVNPHRLRVGTPHRVQPIVVLFLALDDGAGAVSRFRHRGVPL